MATKTETETLTATALPASDPIGVVGVPSFANGKVIGGKYLIERTLAEGGIGIVAAAKHLALQQRVAIKYLKPTALASQALVDRFVREARLCAQITSEHVVRVHDVGTTGEAGPFIVMEYLVGEDLGRTLTRGGPLSVERVVDYVTQACDALAEAHALGIVHRDIKPDNLFVAQRGAAAPLLKIIDFGISKSVAKGNASWARETAATERFGTPLYMSPEQLRSTSRVDARTDIWSLGVVMHELLTGSPPFVGENMAQVCTSIVTDRAPRIRAFRPELPVELEDAVLRCLEKDPANRHRNVAELAQTIAPFGPPRATSRAHRIAEIVRNAGEIVRAPQAPSVADDDGVTLRLEEADSRAVTTIHIRNEVRTGRLGRWAALAGVASLGGLLLIATQRTPRAVPTAAASSEADVGATHAWSAPASVAQQAAGFSSEAGEAREVRLEPRSEPRSEPKSEPAPLAVTSLPAHPRSPASVHPVRRAAPTPSVLSVPLSQSATIRRSQFGERE